MAKAASSSIRRSTRLVEASSPYNASVTLYTLKKEVDASVLSDSEESQPRPISKKPASPKKPKVLKQSLATPHPAPEHWRETYALIKEMRSKIVAPVDTMGCQQAQSVETDPKSRRLSTLISLMLSSQTKDEITHAAVIKLRAALGGSITLDAILQADDKTIDDAIGQVGFHNNKTKYIKVAAQQIRDNFDSEVPKTADELCSLLGVGPKMAYLVLQIAWDLHHGIAVDTHVQRITNRLGWHHPPTKSPEETRLNLQSWLPTELYHDINHLLVGFGQTICFPTRPNCTDCTVNAAGLCPGAEVPKLKKKKVSKKVGGPAIEVELEA